MMIELLTGPLATVFFLVGSGGITTMVAAWFGWRAKREERVKTPSASERVALQVERLADLIERAIQLFEIQMIANGMRK